MYFVDSKTNMIFLFVIVSFVLTCVFQNVYAQETGIFYFELSGKDIAVLRVTPQEGICFEGSCAWTPESVWNLYFEIEKLDEIGKERMFFLLSTDSSLTITDLPRNCYPEPPIHSYDVATCTFGIMKKGEKESGVIEVKTATWPDPPPYDVITSNITFDLAANMPNGDVPHSGPADMSVLIRIKPIISPHDNKICPVAKAVYGTELAPLVQSLRETRENTVMKTESGNLFMNNFLAVYYSLSPTIVKMEEEIPLFQEFVKIMITPMLYTLSILNFVEIDSEYGMISFGILIASLNIGIYFVLPSIIITKIINRIMNKKLHLIRRV